ncbi:hypothetical protein CLOM_g19667 [Closterium sp. NIES-68]|nr:hypothetical protein CLOM_g19667 [Closterium sp. NIES-68]
MGTPAFPDLGKHCSVTSCQQIDFLPFTCDKCRMVFCLSHRMPASHECPRATVGDAVVLLCPLCAKAVRLVGDEDPNVTWARHERSGCDPSNLQRVANKRRCAAQGCKEVLSHANTVTCRDCTRQTCLRHRFGADHACSGSQKNSQPVSFWAAGGAYSEKLMAGMQGAMAGLMAPSSAAAAAAGSSSGSSGKGKAGSRNSSTGNRTSITSSTARASSAGAGGSGVGAAASDLNTVRGTAARRQKQGTGQAVSGAGAQARGGSAEQQQPGAGVARAGGGVGGGAEVCPQCGARFGDAVALINHVETVHAHGGTGVSVKFGGSAGPGSLAAGGSRSGATRAGGGGQGPELCPRCNKRFPDPVALVRHVERDHEGAAGTDKCTIC